MSKFELVLFACTAVALILAVIVASRRERRDEIPRREEPPAFVATPPEPRVQEPPPQPSDEEKYGYKPPEGSISAAQLKVGQTLYMMTETGRYALTLIDPAASLYDAIRVGMGWDGKVARKSFRTIVQGSFVQGYRLVPGWFILGGRLAYREGQGDECPTTTTTSIRQIVLSVPTEQAS